jgi:predicted acylesterase/phospholipase RssA
MHRFHYRKSGSGVNLDFYAGGLEAFEDFGLEPATIAGASGGGITGAVEASGMNSHDLQALLLEFSPLLWKAMDPIMPPVVGPLWHWGMFGGTKLEKLLAPHCAPTFAETYVPFACFTSNMSQQKAAVWSTQHTPDAPLATRAIDGGRLPVAFPPAKIAGEYHRDGGIMYNYPIDFKFEGQDESLPTIGLTFRSTMGAAEPIRNGLDDLSVCMDAMLVACAKQHIDAANWAKTIVVDPVGSSFEFTRSKEQTKQDFATGYRCVAQWLNDNVAGLYPAKS